MSVSRHTMYNLGGAVVPLVVTLLTLPLYLDAIGDERYGILAIIWVLLGYFGLFDAGLGRAVANRIAKEPDPVKRRSVFWTGASLNVAFGMVGGCLLWGSSALILGHLVEIPGALTHEVHQSLPWLAALVPVTTVAGILSGTLIGRELFGALNIVKAGEQSLSQLATLGVATFLSPRLPSLVAGLVVVKLLSVVVSFGVCARSLELDRPTFDRSVVRALVGYGGWVTITSLVSPLMSTFDRVVIGAVAGAQQVAYYTVPYSLAYRLALIPGSISSAVFPRFSAAGSSARTALLQDTFRVLNSLVTPIIVLGIVAMHPFLRWWVGTEFAGHAYLPGAILACGLWFNSYALISFTKLQAEGRPDIVAKFHLIEVLPYAAMLWTLVNLAGIIGAATAWTIRVIADTALLLWAAKPGLTAVREMLVPSVLLAAAFTVVAVLPEPDLAYGCWAAAVVLATIGLSWRSAPESVKGRVVSILRHPLSRSKGA